MIDPTDKLVLRWGSGVMIPTQNRWSGSPFGEQPIQDLPPLHPPNVFFVAEEPDAEEFHTWRWRGASLVSVVYEDLTAGGISSYYFTKTGWYRCLRPWEQPQIIVGEVWRSRLSRHVTETATP